MILSADFIWIFSLIWVHIRTQRENADFASTDVQLENYAIKSEKALIHQGLSRRHFSVANGGDGRDRTDDLHTASVALSQLSYAPISSHTVDFIAFRHAFYIQLSNAFRGSLPVGMRSQLSYTPV